MLNQTTRLKDFDGTKRLFLRYLRDELDFEPTIFELRSLCFHLTDALKSVENDVQMGRYDKYYIPDVAREAMIRFLCYDMGVIESEKDYLYQRSKDKSKLIVKLKNVQAKQHHW